MNYSKIVDLARKKSRLILKINEARLHNFGWRRIVNNQKEAHVLQNVR